MNTSHFDIIIIGGGLVGMTLAHALTNHGWKIALIDAKILPSKNSVQDSRALALSYSSQQILNTLGLWKNIASEAAAINTVHISRRGVFSKTRLRAADIHLPALGYVVSAAELAELIANDIPQMQDVKIFAPATVETVHIKEKTAQVQIQQEGQTHTLYARLIIGADGTQSRVAEQLGVHQEIHPYQQTAIVSILTTDEFNHGNAYKRFIEQGEIALLPLREKNYGVVWTTSNKYAPDLLNLTTEQYLDEVNRKMGRYLGKNLSMSKRISYPLAAVTAYECIRPRFVLLGNAAHTMHPVAAQGLNLALRSVAWLAEVLVETKDDIGDLSILKTYKQRTEADQQQMQSSMHGLAELTSQISAKPLWGIGLNLLDRIPILKRPFIRRTAGLVGRQAKLVRGVTLYE